MYNECEEVRLGGNYALHGSSGVSGELTHFKRESFEIDFLSISDDSFLYKIRLYCRDANI